MKKRWNLFRTTFVVIAALSSTALPAAVRDLPFRQAVSFKYRLAPELEGASLQKLALDSDGVTYVLTSKGVARLFDDRVALDHSIRPLASRLARDITVGRGNLFYLFDEEFLSNGSAGRYLATLHKGSYRRLAVTDDYVALLSSPTNLAIYSSAEPVLVPFLVPRQSENVYAWGGTFYVMAADRVFRVGGSRIDLIHQGKDLTALAFRANEMLVGTRNGYYGVDLQTGRNTFPIQTRLPATEVTCLAATKDGIWVGTTEGVFFHAGPHRFKYYASKRWLDDDHVIDLKPTWNGDLFILTKSGLNKIEFQLMTLAQKAAYYETKIRQRHIRYGFCSELRLTKPGDITSAEMVDTDNDGSWSSLYLASQAFHHAVTGEEGPRANAWETFEALERLQTINGLDGFPARTFERRGFKVSDPERWHPAPDPNWEWKAHTSSDEITAQTFAYAVLYETCAKSAAEKERIAVDYDRMIGHIVKNNYYLIDVDGRPTLWGRWNPEYVNRYPPTIVDRRLNSAEIVAFLQFAHHVTGKEDYRERAFELLQKNGYLQNITNSMTRIRFTPGYVHEGNDMGDEWNHSDDELAFYNYWTLFRYAFNDQLRRAYAGSIRDHWEIEKVERNPTWNFVYAAAGGTPFDLDGALWTLRTFPLDLITWRVENSHRKDLTHLTPNFRHQTTEELLPPDERPTMRWNGNPFDLDGGDGGRGELAGDEFLLPYWMGRYLKLIE